MCFCLCPHFPKLRVLWTWALSIPVNGGWGGIAHTTEALYGGRQSTLLGNWHFEGILCSFRSRAGSGKCKCIILMALETEGRLPHEWLWGSLRVIRRQYQEQGRESLCAASAERGAGQSKPSALLEWKLPASCAPNWVSLVAWHLPEMVTAKESHCTLQRTCQGEGSCHLGYSMLHAHAKKLRMSSG